MFGILLVGMAITINGYTSIYKFYRNYPLIKNIEPNGHDAQLTLGNF